LPEFFDINVSCAICIVESPTKDAIPDVRETEEAHMYVGDENNYSLLWSEERRQYY